ncbi:MAG: ATP-binding protein [bacterium]|nr:ATP-binding protein [Candidatus Minthenecus merdequi]
MAAKLIGRKRECKVLDDCMTSDRSEFVIVYGRRRVGKTFLVDQYFKGKFDFTFVGGSQTT